MVIFHSSEVFSVLGAISGDQGQRGHVIRFDAIDYEGGIWLVPSWLVSTDEKHKLPERIVRLPHARLSEADAPDLRYTIAGPVPKPVLSGSSQDGYTVIEQPNIRVELGNH